MTKKDITAGFFRAFEQLSSEGKRGYKFYFCMMPGEENLKVSEQSQDFRDGLKLAADLATRDFAHAHNAMVGA